MLSALSPSSSAGSSPRSRASHLSITTSQTSHDDPPPPPSPGPKTAAFFGTSWTSPKSPSFEDKPKMAPRSLTHDFFNLTSGFEARPTPPPSLYSGSPPPSRSSSPPRLLSRIFPSRHTSIRERPSRHFEEFHYEDEPSSMSSASSSSSSTSASPPSPIHSEPGPYTSSPVIATSPLVDETPRPADAKPIFLLSPGSILSGEPETDCEVALKRQLGQGTFSSVWLATANYLPQRRKSRRLRRSTVRPVDGTRPISIKAIKRVRRENVGNDEGVQRASSTSSTYSVFLDERDGEYGCPKVPKTTSREQGTLVAVKMTPIADDRTRVSFIREVEVLRHISHPNIVEHLASFTTPSHHVMVMERISGGELFDIVNSDAAHAALGENMLRRIWRELCNAVAWMHGVFLVHRDIKLENILLTAPLSAAPPEPQPLVKLTDFGLSRFIDPENPMLTTRCGSESYAAPELIIPTTPYDARCTDAWACGAVLFALATRFLPFGDGPLQRESGPGVHLHRRRWLMRIAKGEYEWPEPPVHLNPRTTDKERFGTDLASSPGLRRVVGRLLVRDPIKRAKLKDLWSEEWMYHESLEGDEDDDDDEESADDEEPESESQLEEDSTLNRRRSLKGHLLDKGGIARIAREEVV